MTDTELYGYYLATFAKTASGNVIELAVEASAMDANDDDNIRILAAIALGVEHAKNGVGGVEVCSMGSVMEEISFLLAAPESKE